MNKFTRLLTQVTTIIFVATTMLSSVYAEEKGTGSIVLTKTGSVLEKQESEEFGSGTIILELEKEIEEKKPITNSGSLSVTESDTNTGSVLFETETGTSLLNLEETGTGEILIESEGREKAMEEITTEDEYTEILIKYRDDKINVLQNTGKKQAKDLIEQKNNEIKPFLRQTF